MSAIYKVILALLIVLLGSTQPRAQNPAPTNFPSMDGWQRLPDAQLRFEADHAACTPRPLPKGLPTGGVSGNADGPQPVPQQPSFSQCMRAKGWIKP